MFNLITESDVVNRGVSGLPTTPDLNVAELQAKFDELSLDVIIPKFNELVTLLNEVGISEKQIANILANNENEIPTSAAILAVIAEMGGGDMLRAAYDNNRNGIVDDAEKLGGNAPEYYATQEDLEEVLGVTASKEELQNESSTIKAALQSETEARKAEVAVERARIDNLTTLPEGSTTGDAELIDGRTDYTGSTWENIGAHIRGISSQLSSEIVELSTYLYEEVELSPTLGYYYKNSGNYSNAYNDGKWYCAKLECKAGDIYSVKGKCYGTQTAFVIFGTDAETSPIISQFYEGTDTLESYSVCEVAPQNCKYIFISWYGDEIPTVRKIKNRFDETELKLLSDIAINDTVVKSRKPVRICAQNNTWEDKTVNFICASGKPNMIDGSLDFSGEWNNSSMWQDNGTYNGMQIKTGSALWNGMSKAVSCVAGRVYAFSFWCNIPSGVSVKAFSVDTTKDGYGEASPREYLLSDTNGEWERKTVLFRCTSNGYLYPRLEKCSGDGAIQFCGLKLEIDNGTDYCTSLADNNYDFTRRITSIPHGNDIYGWTYHSLTVDFENYPYITTAEGCKLRVDYYGETKEKPYSKLTANFLGDSLTYGVNTAKQYFKTVGEILGLSAVYGYGVGGTGISYGGDNSFVSRYIAMDDADIVCVFGCTNDFGENVPIGNETDTDTSTFFGAMNTLCEGLVNKYVGKTIIFATSTNRNCNLIPASGAESGSKTNTTGATLEDYVNAMIKACGNFGIPCLDLYHNSGIYPYSANIISKIMSDGIHPNTWGHEIIAKKIAQFIVNQIS